MIGKLRYKYRRPVVVNDRERHQSSLFVIVAFLVRRIKNIHQITVVVAFIGRNRNKTGYSMGQ
jgi:hypothetical protein